MGKRTSKRDRKWGWDEIASDDYYGVLPTRDLLDELAYDEGLPGPFVPEPMFRVISDPRPVELSPVDELAEAHAQVQANPPGTPGWARAQERLFLARGHFDEVLEDLGVGHKDLPVELPSTGDAATDADYARHAALIGALVARFAARPKSLHYDVVLDWDDVLQDVREALAICMSKDRAVTYLSLASLTRQQHRKLLQHIGHRSVARKRVDMDSPEQVYLRAPITVRNLHDEGAPALTITPEQWSEDRGKPSWLRRKPSLKDA